MDIKEAEKIIDDMYQDRMNTRIEKIEKGTVIHAEKEVTFTKLEEASVLLLREELSLKRKIEEQEKVIELMANFINNIADIDEDICKVMGEDSYCKEHNKEGKCVKCVKSYFKKKARDENGNRNHN